MHTQTDSLESLLAKHSFFEGINPSYLETLRTCAATQRLRRGQYVFRECQEAKFGYLICTGKVAVQTSLQDSPGSITIQTLGDDEVLGWSWLVQPHFWRFDARAIEPSLVIVLDGETLRAEFEERSDLGYELFKRLSFIMTQRLEMMRLKLLEFHRNELKKQKAAKKIIYVDQVLDAVAI
jgi:CRP/FNR family transcriptional regulator, cyclic AMP receptor protein